MKIIPFAILSCFLFHLSGAQVLFEGIKKINNYETYVRVIGKGKPVIILHGGPGMDHSYFLPYMDKLATNYQLIYYDQRGMGKSSANLDSSSMSLALLIDDIDALRKELKLKEVTILGHSWGGLLAMKYAIKYPKGLKSLILLNSVSASKEFDQASFATLNARMSKEDIAKRNELVNSDGMKKGDTEVISDLFRISFKNTFYDKRYADSLNLVFPKDYSMRSGLLNYLFKDLYAYDLHPQLAGLTVPTLIVQGDYDALPLEAAQKLANSIKGSKLVVIKDCGHFPFIEAQKEFKDIIESFMN